MGHINQKITFYKYLDRFVDVILLDKRTFIPITVPTNPLAILATPVLDTWIKSSILNNEDDAEQWNLIS